MTTKFACCQQAGEGILLFPIPGKKEGDDIPERINKD